MNLSVLRFMNGLVRPLEVRANTLEEAIISMKLFFSSITFLYFLVFYLMMVLTIELQFSLNSGALLFSELVVLSRTLFLRFKS